MSAKKESCVVQAKLERGTTDMTRARDKQGFVHQTLKIFCSLNTTVCAQVKSHITRNAYWTGKNASLAYRCTVNVPSVPKDSWPMVLVIRAAKSVVVLIQQKKVKEQHVTHVRQDMSLGRALCQSIVQNVLPASIRKPMMSHTQNASFVQLAFIS